MRNSHTTIRSKKIVFKQKTEWEQDGTRNLLLRAFLFLCSSRFSMTRKIAWSYQMCSLLFWSQEHIGSVTLSFFSAHEPHHGRMPKHAWTMCLSRRRLCFSGNLTAIVVPRFNIRVSRARERMESSLSSFLTASLQPAEPCSRKHAARNCLIPRIS